MLMVLATLGAAPSPALATTPVGGARDLLTPARSASEHVPTQAVPSISVQLEQVSPAVVAPGRRWSVKGTISNTGTTTLDVERVRVRTAYRALDTVGELQDWIDDGEVIRTPREVGSDTMTSSLAPGESASFLIIVPGDAVGPPFSFASLPLRLDVEAADDTPLAQVRTVLPWYADSAAENPLEVSWVVPLTVPPELDLTAEEPDRTQAWLSTVGPKSPAQIWMDGLTAYHATFVVDPSLLLPLPAATDITEEPASDLTAPPQTDAPSTTEPAQPTATQAPPTDSADPDGTTQGAPKAPDTASQGSGDPADDVADASAPGELPDQRPLSTPEVQDATPVQEAELGLQERIGVLSRNQLRWLPVADPDVAALTDLDADQATLERTLGASLPPSVLQANQLLKRGRHGIAWPAWTTIDATRIETLQTMSSPAPLSTLVVPRSVFSDATGLNRDAVGTSAQHSKVALYGYDERVSALFDPTETDAGDGATTQLMLAYLLARYQQFPADSGSLIIAPRRGAAIDASALDALTGAMEQAPWIVHVAAEDLPIRADVRLSQSRTAPEQAPSPLSTASIARIEQIRATLNDVATVLPQQETAQTWQPVLDGLYSTRWRDNDDQWSALLKQIDSTLATIVDGVRIQETNVNFLANDGLIQLTVVNDLPIGLRDLQVELVPGNARLRVAEQPPPIAIGPSSRATVQFRAEAVAAGQVPVRATLSTPTGLQIGQAQELDVHVRPTGIWIYWLLGGVAGVILILGLTRAIRRPSSPAASNST